MSCCLLIPNAGSSRVPGSDPQAAVGGGLPHPSRVDNNVVSEGWAAVGGHGSVIQQLKEMVLLPLQYPEVFKHMGITPPRLALGGSQEHRHAPLMSVFAGRASQTMRLASLAVSSVEVIFAVMETNSF